MDLDIRTIMVVFSALTIMFAGLLALAGKYAGEVEGVPHWAVANLLIGLGLGSAYFVGNPGGGGTWAVAASTLIACGLCLQLTGIQAFKGRRINWAFGAVLIVFVLLNGVWYSVIHTDVATRAINNSLLYGLIYAASARELLVRVDMPMRVAYWVTGGSFLLLVVVVVARAAMIWSMPTDYPGLFHDIPLNPLTFLMGCVIQLSISVGFLLMLDYRLVGELATLASNDALTGVFNRRRLEEEAVRLQARCQRTGDSLAVMMIDIDHFKQVNDHHGHPVGDEVLRRLARTVQSIIRADDYFARYGGEEFCILLPSTTMREASLLAERLRQAFAETDFNPGGKPLKCTISIGIADSLDLGLDFKVLVHAADQALYRAKESGRNQVALHGRSAL